jgi:1,4-alpha-glucan branching enzyme
MSRLSADDVFLFNEGTHGQLYDKLGAHPGRAGGADGTWFAVWAPNAAQVAVVGDFNGWRTSHPLEPRERSGIWEGFIPGVGTGAAYKFRIVSRHGGYRVDKADPFAFSSEVPPGTTSIVRALDYDWGDEGWMRERHRRNALGAPIAVYEMHLGSWRRVPEEGNRPLGYRELAPRLAEYVTRFRTAS